MINIGIIILNYLAYKETINCVNDFLRQKREEETTVINVKIIVVDNCSPNRSYEILKQTFLNNRTVKIIKSDHNLGFAQGNNLGYQKLSEYMKSDFVIIANEDIVIERKDFLFWIIACYEKHKFGVLGPAIFCKNGGYYQSPSDNRSRDLHYCRKKLFILRLRQLKCFFQKTFFKNNKEPFISIEENNRCQKLQFDKTLHGAAVIFSQDYFARYAEPFHPATFLYMEEDLLRLRCDRKGIRMVFDPSFEVIHLHHVSTNKISEYYWDKKYLRLKNLSRSLKIYMKELWMDERN